MSACASEVAHTVFNTFKQLPAKAKPRLRPDSTGEWTVLSGIVLSGAGNHGPECVSLGTGMRCLPHVKLSKANGTCLHDWHAEVVAIRAFNLFLLQECERIASDQAYTSRYVRLRDLEEYAEHELQPFAIRDDVSVQMYTSEAPCGDASMELTMDAQQDSTPWTVPDDQGTDLLGRGHFSRLGVVRRKPGRADAPESLSKSCSDKLAQRQCTSLLLSLTSTLVHPARAYLHRLVVPQSQHNPTALQRAFAASGRMAPMVLAQPAWTGGYSFKPFEVCTVEQEFERCRPRFTATKSTGSNITVMWTPSRHEVLIGGTIQGNKQFSARGTSSVSRIALWQTVLRIGALVGASTITHAKSYAEFKRDATLDARRAVKNDVRSRALQPWPSNDGDDAFGLEAGPQCSDSESIATSPRT